MQNYAYGKKQPDEPVIGAGLRRAPPQVILYHAFVMLQAKSFQSYKIRGFDIHSK